VIGTRRIWACTICGGIAGSIEVDEPVVRRVSFTGVLTLVAPDDELVAAVAASTAADLHSLDPELVPWWCPTCTSSYCGKHWARWDVFDDQHPELHDSVRGRCPQGHERMLED
jgi:hypothetical protein